MAIDVLEIQKALKILYGDHEVTGYVELRLIDPTRRASPRNVSFAWGGPDSRGRVAADLAQACTSDGVSRNCYVGRSLRTSRGYGAALRVGWITCLSLDIDVPAGLAPQGEALSAVERVVMDRWGSANNAGVVMTGHGYQVWFPLDAPVDIRGRQLWWASLQREWEKHETSGLPATVKCDPQFDVPRVVKLPGTTAYKDVGGVSGWPKTALVVREPSDVLYSVDLVDRFEDAVEETNKEAMNLASTPIPPRFWGLLVKDVALKEAWAGTLGGLQDSSQSCQDMALVGKLRKRGFTADESYTILKMSPRIKRKGRWDDSYARLTISKAYGG